MRVRKDHDAVRRGVDKHALGAIVLLCDPSYELHARLGIRKGAKGTVRSVLVVRKGAPHTLVKKSTASPANSVGIAEKAIADAAAAAEAAPAEEETKE